MKKLIYFDNSATSFPKPREVILAMEDYFHNIGASPGRSGHRLSIASARIVMEARIALSLLLGIEDPLDIVFTKNITEALNIVTHGLLKSGDHVITTAMEHNSVIRPLRECERHGGVEVSVISCSPCGEPDLEALAKAIKPNTKAIFMLHASNVTGAIMPIDEVGRIAQKNGIVFVVDGAQSAGAIPINLQNSNIDIFAFTGHKSLLGPQGTGGLYIKKSLAKEMQQFVCGGTGSRSEFEIHPDFMPDKFEAGTPNTIGIAGLLGALKYIEREGVENIRTKEERLTKMFLDGLDSIKGIHAYGLDDIHKMVAVVSFNVDGISPSEASLILDEDFGIMARVGLHCAPLAHRTIGTFPVGTIRFSFGYFNTEVEIQYALEAIEKIAKNKNAKL
ncbi:MAG: aminotransferase class V-fold PLP-dependent enzyme [Deltaproteobacteria bacterium]